MDLKTNIRLGIINGYQNDYN